jgi:hypothetical protein
MNYRNPKKLKNGTFRCEVEHEIHGWLPFTATSYDPEPHGKILFQTLNSDPTIPEESLEEAEASLAIKIRLVRNSLLLEVDRISLSPLRFDSLTEEQKNELSQYRVDLLNIPQQSTFPSNVIFPEIPSFLV